MAKPVATAGKLHFLINQAGRSRLLIDIRVSPSLLLAKRSFAAVDPGNFGDFPQQMILYRGRVRFEIGIRVGVR